jgi:hypothetical protein
LIKESNAIAGFQMRRQIGGMDIQSDDRHPPYILTVAPLGADGPSMAPWPRSFLPNQTSNLLSRGTWLSFLVRRIAAQRSHVNEPGAIGIRSGAGGGDRAASRRANPPGAVARADARVGEAVGSALCIFVNSRVSPQAAVSGCAKSR